jgi:hypothetical protein
LIERMRNQEADRADKLAKVVLGLACRPNVEADPERVKKETATVAIRKITKVD